jgi:hypothetical protein
MTKTEKEQYADADELRKILVQLVEHKKYRLDCGHHVTFNHNFGSNITIINGKHLKIICSLCGY